MAASIQLPELPAPHAGLVDYIADNPETPMAQIMAPYREYEAKLRSVFAQDRGDPRLDDPYINVLPLFTDKTSRIATRARDLASESQEEKDKYIMALPDDKRRPHGSPATVGSLTDFRKNFNIFSENSLADLDWGGVVAAGSSVVNCLLPVPAEFNKTKRNLREYYHEKFCPASDVDLFLYGLSEEQAIEKIKQIEQSVRDAILSEVTVIRTKYAITIASQYPTRHVQIVLRSYKNISEILSGFDIDASSACYDGNQVYVSPRALGSYITQINPIDLTRRSPSYENRLSKYSHRNFEVYCPGLVRERVDPTIFERSFQRTLGLARLLVLEKLPDSNARESYLNRRRQERGRPTAYNPRVRLPGNIKDYHEDEVADWVGEFDISNYHTFTVPYGERFNAKRIEKLLYSKDLLLNAEWNQQKGREVYLHRHPAFFGRVEDVIRDCCGHCPVPVTPEEIETAEKDSEVYIKGKVQLLVDQPGRQQIGSFNPLTEDDWTDMAYVGNTARLCQSIVDCDLDEVLGWLSQSDADPNTRDYTGRTPLQLAVICSTPEVVKCFVDHGAKITARMADGKTALHLAAERGIPEIVQTLMEKSIANEELEEERQDQKRKIMRGSQKDRSLPDDADKETAQEEDDKEDEHSDVEVIGYEEDSDDGVQSLATGSFVKVKSEEKGTTEELEEPGEGEPDFFKIDVLAWDIPYSPLHLAIASGHEDVVKLLCDFGSDALLPVKLLDSDKEPIGAILTMTLSVKLPIERAKSMTKLLLDLGATSSQADLHGWTAFHRYVQTANEQVVDVLLDHDKLGTKTAINHLTFTRYNWSSPSSPLLEAVALRAQGNLSLVLKLINAGANVEMDFETWLKSAKKVSGGRSNNPTLSCTPQLKERYDRERLHPLISALRCTTSTEVPIALLERGADPNSMPGRTYSVIHNNWHRSHTKGETVLDLVRERLHQLRTYGLSGSTESAKPLLRTGLDGSLYTEGTYQHWVVASAIRQAKRSQQDDEIYMCRARSRTVKDVESLMAAMESKISGLQKLEEVLIQKGAKTFEELYPEIAEENPHLYQKKKDKKHQTKQEQKPDQYTFSFSRVIDLTTVRRDACIQLFEAAWSGDLDKIRSLTLHTWGEDEAEPPLQIAIQDSERNSPFSLAFFRGHYDVAWAIADIAHAQYSPPEEEKMHYQLEAGGDSSGTEDYSDSDGGDEPRIVSKTVDKKFTIDNIGEVSLSVKSPHKAIHFIDWICNVFEVKDGVPDFTTCQKLSPMDFFIRSGRDLNAFKRFLKICIHFGGKKYHAAHGDHVSYAPSESRFTRMIEQGRLKMLKEIIRKTGAGIPLDHLVKQSGVEMKARPPRYYQGLTVYGKKRKDWATAGRRLYSKPTGIKTPPILHAAFHGKRKMVEWLLSDEPLKLYTEFSRSKAAEEDSRLEHLTSTAGRFELVVSKWLGNRNDLVLHCAVAAVETEESISLGKYLIKTCPWSLEAKDSSSNTPLLTAAYFGRVQFMKLLVAAGADESVRNRSGETVIHRMVSEVKEASQLKEALDLLDSDLRVHMFKQRSNLESGGMTPLHLLVQRFRSRTSADTYKCEQIFKLFLEYSKGIEVDMLNAAGDSVLHTAVMAQSPWLTRLLVSFRPKLLYRENAVGRTPVELAHHKYMSGVFGHPGNSGPSEVCHNPAAWLKRVHEAALPSPPDEYAAGVGKVWEICRTEMARYPNTRRLVSLHEANDVAKRLGEKYTSSRYFSTGPRVGDDNDKNSSQGNDNEVIDVVGGWLAYNARSAWKKYRLRDEKERAREARLGEVCKECGHRHPAGDVETDQDSSDGDSSDEDSDDTCD